MTRTEHYQLPQWEAHDPVRREDFNAAMVRIDAGLSAKVEQTVLEQAEQELTEQIGTARSAAETAQSAASAAQETADAAYSPDNPYYVLHSYTGTGAYGSKSPCTVTTGFRPSMVVVTSSAGAGFTAAYPSTMGGVHLYVSWLEDGVSWRANGPEYQYNEEGVKYSCIVFR